MCLWVIVDEGEEKSTNSLVEDASNENRNDSKGENDPFGEREKHGEDGNVVKEHITHWWMRRCNRYNPIIRKHDHKRL